jgi:tetratricopeptide (TPR) repeat protein
MPSTITLPPKENALFKRILKCYEQKQYKNGLKFAKQILSNQKFSEHGETQAMKGLILNCLGRKDEAYENVRKGLTNDLRSHVCWHVYGLLQRSDKKYSEAIKCYRNALKWDKDNMQILRDLSLLQIQMRDLEGYKETRHQLFQLRPTQRASWIGFAMSYHLLEDYDMALKILEEFRKTQKKPGYDYEYSELLLYQNMVVRESGNVSGALAHLDEYESAICDKIIFREIRGKYLLELGRLEEADAVYVELLKRNPENHEYYKRMEQARKAESEEDRLKIYDEYVEKFPRAQVPKRLPLNFSTGAEFETRLRTYLINAIRKGVPPLFVDLEALYTDPVKAKVIEKTVSSFMENLLKYGSFDAENKIQETPTCLLWTYYYMSQQCDLKEDYPAALDLVNQAIEHTPTLIELFTLKGKIYKHAGNPEEAVRCLDEAQSMDTADRYINCKCAKYMLRANKTKEAEDMCSKFTREGIPAMDNLNEMQCMWFQSECATAFQRLGQYGEALKKCFEIDRHFTEIIEDQFDFHTYCMRKMTLKSYVSLLRLEDEIRSHKFYEKCAKVAIETFIQLFDKPPQDSENDLEINADDLDPSELKKRMNKAKKAKRKADLEKAAIEQDKKKKELFNKNKKKGGDDDLENAAKDELIPEKLARSENPLDEAVKFLEPLLLLAKNKVNTHLLAFEIYYRKGKVLMMLQALKKALELDPVNLDLQYCITRFLDFIARTDKTMNEPVKKVLSQSMPSLLQGKTAGDVNARFIKNNSSNLYALFLGGKLTAKLNPSESGKAVKLVTNLDPALSSRNVKTCTTILEALQAGDFGTEGKDAVVSFKDSCSKLFPLTLCFMENIPNYMKSVVEDLEAASIQD